MELRIEDELYARALGWEVLRYIQDQEDRLHNMKQDTEGDALRVLEQLKRILDDPTLDDPDCFLRIEHIVQAFYAHGISTTRHDWG